VLRVATLPSDAGSEAFYGIDMGFSRKPDSTSTSTHSRVDRDRGGGGGGALDIGFSNTISIAAAHKRGLPFTFVAPASIYASSAPTSVLMVRKDSPMRTARDLNGKTIGANALKNIAQFARWPGWIRTAAMPHRCVSSKCRPTRWPWRSRRTASMPE